MRSIVQYIEESGFKNEYLSDLFKEIDGELNKAKLSINTSNRIANYRDRISCNYDMTNYGWLNPIGGYNNTSRTGEIKLILRYELPTIGKFYSYDVDKPYLEFYIWIRTFVDVDKKQWFNINQDLTLKTDTGYIKDNTSEINKSVERCTEWNFKDLKSFIKTITDASKREEIDSIYNSFSNRKSRVTDIRKIEKIIF